jgi:hypothetical protein
MTPLISILIPSRGRVQGLLKTIDSFKQHPDALHFEIRVRFDEDDLESRAWLKPLSRLDVNVHIGRRGRGYADLNKFYTHMAEASDSPWIWIMNDDAYLVSTTSFIDVVRSTPLHGVLLQPETYGLNACRYHGKRSAFPLAPNGCWRPAYPEIVDPADAWLHEELVLRQGWDEVALPGVTIQHDWDNKPPA